MAFRKKGPSFQPWVETIAGRIGDPVTRLRFLRAVAPLNVPGRWYRRLCSGATRVIVLVIVGLAALTCIFLMRANGRALPAPVSAGAVVVTTPSAQVAHRSSEVWRVEQSASSEVYSNGLRVDDAFLVSNHPRQYVVFPMAGGGEPAARTVPAGIVFHSTESRQAPFEAGHNETLKKIGESLLDYIRRRRSYHFVIDRFGRVFRIVAEADSANHAGYSVWADDRWQYVNLNESFLGVAFEAETRPAAGEAPATAAQVRSAVMLTEMLRARYRISAANCVTHAQVSVNPSNMRVGYHVDWAAEFPFEELGLTNNYTAALPSIWAFGFESDTAFLDAAGGNLRAGVDAAANLLDRQAARAGIRVPAYRKRLQEQYRRKLAVVRHMGSVGDADR